MHRQPALITSISAFFLISLAPIVNAETSIDLTQIQVGELVFNARVSGPPDGQLVVLLHGFPQTSFAFRRQLEQLAAAGFRVVAPDQRGYSPEARPAQVSSYTMGALVSDVVGIADALGHRRFHLVGHDWGGAVAWVTALRHPERLISLAVLSTPHVRALAAARADPEGDQASRSAYFSDFAADDAEERFLANDASKLRALFDPAVFGVEEIQVFIDTLGYREALRGALNWYRALGLTTAPAVAAPVPPRRPNVPTLYVWGEQDSAFGRDAAEATEDFVQGPYRFVPLEGIGHWILEQAPEQLDPLLREHLEMWRTAELSELHKMELLEPGPSARNR